MYFKSSLRRHVAAAISLLFVLFSPDSLAQNPWNGKVVLQGFWWDYTNNNYPNAWADYLTDLSPRLRDLGIDMVWIPPTPKNAGTNKVGYSVFDAYDLGDKYQKGTVTTRFGTKDQYLRMVAVMHANGIGVVQDIVLNHVSDAGSSIGAGGQDPEATYSLRNESGYKNFRYVSYATPVTDESATDYFRRSGRWPKNYTNFHPNQWVNTTSGNYAEGGFGPDFAYEDARSFGQSTNVTGYNPPQYNNYNVAEARKWIVWLKKQTGIDGLRWDVAKGFPPFVFQDLSWNVKYNAVWANGGANMFNVGEYVGSKDELDTWVNDVQFANGGTEEMAGTFDFSLRNEIKNMVSGNGAYNLGTIINAQQTRRFRTVPFVNNHDTFRPQKDANGNYTGWDASNELGGGHIDPFDVRLAASYAVMLSVDGSPQVFFEDLFDIGGTGKRFTHLPTNSTDLPVRSDIANLLWCHQKLNFKAGAYTVRWQAPDLLIIERSGRAVIGVNDNFSDWQIANIQTNFAPGTRLHDYSGANADDIFVDGNSRITVAVPPCNGSAARRGYCVWAPAGVTGGFAPGVIPTSQEWEMSDDLGDSHPSSLQQGGALPAGSTAYRTVGRIFCEAGQTVTVNLYPTNNTPSLAADLFNASGSSLLASTSGSGTLTLNYTPSATDYYTIKVKNNSTTNPGQSVFVKATYQAPATVATNSFARLATETDKYVLQAEAQGLNVLNFPNPIVMGTAHFRFQLPKESQVRLSLKNALGQEVDVVAEGRYAEGKHEVDYSTQALAPGVYIYQLVTPYGSSSGKLVIR